MTKQTKTAKGPTRKTAPAAKGFEPELAKEINYRLEQAKAIEGKADDHRLAAALRLKEAKDKCKTAKVNFHKWYEANIRKEFSWQTARKLARVGEAKDPAKALEDLREKTKTSTAKSRRRKATADPVTVAETAIATMPEEDAQAFVQKQAKKLGVDAKAKGTGDALADAKFAFDALAAEQITDFLGYVVAKTGAEVKLFGTTIAAPTTPRRRRQRVA